MNSENINVDIPDYMLEFASSKNTVLSDDLVTELASNGKFPDDIIPNINKMLTREELESFYKNYYLWLRYLYLYTKYELSGDVNKKALRKNFNEIYGLDLRIFIEDSIYKIELTPGEVLLRKSGTNWEDNELIYKRFSFGNAVKNIGDNNGYLSFGSSSTDNIMSVDQEYEADDIIHIFVLCTTDYESGDYSKGIIGADLNINGNLITNRFKSTFPDDTDVYIRRIGSTRTYLINNYLIAQMTTKKGLCYYDKKFDTTVLNKDLVTSRAVEVDMGDYLSGPYTSYKVILNVLGSDLIQIDTGSERIDKIKISEYGSPERWIVHSFENFIDKFNIIGNFSKLNISVVYFNDQREQW